tara:strand:+ start:738 stop:926 length:189 start_codon:yes stop_codon:yes gene_type:complete
MGSDYKQIESLLNYAKSIEVKTMGKDFEKYRRNAKLLDDCRNKKFPLLESIGLIKKQNKDDE